MISGHIVEMETAGNGIDLKKKKKKEKKRKPCIYRRYSFLILHDSYIEHSQLKDNGPNYLFDISFEFKLTRHIGKNVFNILVNFRSIQLPCSLYPECEG